MLELWSHPEPCFEGSGASESSKSCILDQARNNGGYGASFKEHQILGKNHSLREQRSTMRASIFEISRGSTNSCLTMARKNSQN